MTQKDRSVGVASLAKAARDARGMTLLEVMITLAILSLVVGGIFSILLQSFHVYWKGDINTQVSQGSRLAIDRLTRDLRQARRLYSGTTGGFTFALGGAGCSPSAPQISFVLPHFGNVTLSDNSVIYATDANASGTVPYDGSWVSYYLAATPGGTTPTVPGPGVQYLEKTVYDGTALSTVTIASNITNLAFSAGGTCPTTQSREVTVTVTASQQGPTSDTSVTSGVTMDVTFRNL